MHRVIVISGTYKLARHLHQFPRRRNFAAVTTNLRLITVGINTGAFMPELNLDYLNIDELPAHELEAFANDLYDILDNAGE